MKDDKPCVPIPCEPMEERTIELTVDPDWHLTHHGSIFDLCDDLLCPTCLPWRIA